MTQIQLTRDSLKHYRRLRYDRRLVIFGSNCSCTLISVGASVANACMRSENAKKNRIPISMYKIR
ncbi:hypothetical protein N7536_010004 [Penicillium majusculum]|nr:hypothetical protein N7536_010004 [Penicillium majusculum]